MPPDLNFESDVRPIPGWLTEREATYLYESARRLSRPYEIVEIGSWKGRSTISLAKGSLAGQKVLIHAIDPHTGSPEHHRMFGKVDTYEEFISNLDALKVKEVVHPIRLASTEAIPQVTGPIGFVFIDGAHEMSSVRQDQKYWFPELNQGFRIAFHDTFGLLGPYWITAVLLLTSKHVRHPVGVDTITSLEKTDQNTPLERLQNIGFLIIRTLWYGPIGWFRLRCSGTST